MQGPSNQVTSGSDVSNNNETVQAPQQDVSQQAQLGALFAALLGGGQAQVPNASLPAAGAGLLAAGFQAMATNARQQQQQQSQATMDSQQPLQQQLQQLQALLQQQQHPPPPQQQQQQQPPPPPHPQQVSGSDQANALASMAVPLLLSQMMQQGQALPVAQPAPLEQLQQILGATVPGMSAFLSQMQGNPRQLNQGQFQLQRQDQQHPVAAAVPSNLDATVPRSSDSNAFPLYMSRDKECLSSYQCFLRQQIELFAAGVEDVKSTMPGRNKAIVLGQVGIRCRHCAILPARYRGTGATYYPARLDRLYQAAQNMAQTHFTKHCRHIPQEVVNELAVLLQGSKSSAGAGKKYWSDGARLLGAYEDEDILRLDRNRATL